MTPFIVAGWVILGVIIALALAYFDRLPDDEGGRGMIGVLTSLLWPIVLVVVAVVATAEAGDRRRERVKAGRREAQRQLAISEAELNRDGFYGGAIKAEQLAYDNAGRGLYRHALTLNSEDV